MDSDHVLSAVMLWSRPLQAVLVYLHFGWLLRVPAMVTASAVSASNNGVIRQAICHDDVCLASRTLRATNLNGRHQKSGECNR